MIFFVARFQFDLCVSDMIDVMLCLRQILFRFLFKLRTIFLIFVPVCSLICDLLDPIDDSCRKFFGGCVLENIS